MSNKILSSRNIFSFFYVLASDQLKNESLLIIVRLLERFATDGKPGNEYKKQYRMAANLKRRTCPSNYFFIQFLSPMREAFPASRRRSFVPIGSLVRRS